jgi:tetratricopeptide (TPR) repeat protein
LGRAAHGRGLLGVALGYGSKESNMSGAAGPLRSPVRLLFTCFAATAAFLIPGLSRAEDLRPWVGKRVVQKASDFTLKGNDSVVDRRKLIEIYDVDRANETDLWLQGTSRSGWAKPGDVMPAEQAMAYFSDAIKAKPTDAFAYAMRAILRLDKGEYDQAIADDDEVIKLDPKDAIAFSNRGDAWYAKKDYDKAIADYTEALKLDPKYAIAFSNRGIARHAKKDYDKAIVDYSDAIMLDPKLATAYDDRGIAWFFKKDYDRAVSDFNDAIKIDPRLASAYFNRGAVWAAKKEYDKAISDYTDAIKIDPNDVVAFNNRGAALYAKKDLNRAVGDFNAAIKLAPTYARAYNNRGDARYAQKDYEHAIADYSEAIRLNPNDASSFDTRAWIWATCPDQRFRDGGKAVKSATSACELTQWEDFLKLDTLAAACAEAKDYASAVKWQTKAIELAPKVWQTRLNNRLSYFKAKKPYRETAPQ